METPQQEPGDEIVPDVENGLKAATPFDAELRVAEEGLEWVRGAMNEGRAASAVHEEMRCVFRKLRELAGANTRHATEHPARLDELRTRVVQHANVAAHFMLLASRLREAAPNPPERVAELEQMHKDMAVYVDTQQSIVSNITALTDAPAPAPDHPAASAPDPEAIAKHRKKMKRLKIIIVTVIVLIMIAVVVAIVMSQIV